MDPRTPMIAIAQWDAQTNNRRACDGEKESNAPLHSRVSGEERNHRSGAILHALGTQCRPGEFLVARGMAISTTTWHWRVLLHPPARGFCRQGVHRRRTCASRRRRKDKRTQGVRVAIAPVVPSSRAICIRPCCRCAGARGRSSIAV